MYDVQEGRAVEEMAGGASGPESALWDRMPAAVSPERAAYGGKRAVPGATIFLDRDGTINEEVHYLHRKEDLKLLPMAAEAIRLWNEKGFRVVVVTNQAGVARGYYGEQDVKALHRYMDQLLGRQGARIDEYYYCPHHPEHGIGRYKVKCHCRKPDTGMFEAAAQDGAVDKAHSYMVGDKWLDIQAGARFGVHTALVGTGYGKQLLEEYVREQPGDKEEQPMEYFGEDLYAVALWTLAREGLAQ